MTDNTKISVTLTPELRLEQAIKKAGIENPAQIESLAIAGKINYSDWQYIHENMTKTLRDLDLSNSLFENETFFGLHFGSRSPFVDFTALSSVTVSNLYNEIEPNTFSRCTGLVSVTIPNSVTKIGQWAFFNCSDLSSIAIPDSVTEIGDRVFKGCTSLTSVCIPFSVTGIGDKAFENCPAYITVHPDNPVYTSKNGKIVFNKIKAVSGRIGKLDWKFSNGVLTIKANGKNSDYDDFNEGWGWGDGSRIEEGNTTWRPYRKVIKKIIFKGNNEWVGRQKLHSVTFENWSVPSYGDDRMQVMSIISRAFKGYVSQDLWSIDNWFSVQIPRMLMDFKREAIAYTPIMAYEEWLATLDRMAFCLSEMKHHGYTTDEKPYEYREAMKNEGLALFCKYFNLLGW